jgi:ribonuclease HI
MGCGVYIPFAADPASRRHSFFVPCPKAHIVLGELMAIWRAVQLAPSAGTLHVLTDSLTSLYLISRAARRPASLHSPHAALLHAIVAAVCARDGPTLLQKVRAHVGITGNEIADRLAAAGLP